MRTPTSGSAERSQDGWWEYLEAARRKVRIAQHHLASLEKQETALGLHAEDVSIPVQASFEGLLYATIAASDQIAEAINLGFELHLTDPPATLQTALETMPKSRLRTRLFEWQ